MDAAPYLTALVAVTARAVNFVTDEPSPRLRLLVSAGASLSVLALCFRSGPGLVAALVVVLAQTLIPLVTEASPRRVLWRLVLMPSLLIPFLLPAALTPFVRESWLDAGTWLRMRPVGSELFAGISVRFVCAHGMGLLLCLSDCNLILRSLLRALDVSPPAPDVDVDPSQYLRGGLVGAVERLLIYVFAANDAFNAIAFVITVKGIVRYQEIVRHHSAEYVLIGTLLSTLLAMLIGMLFALIA